MICATPCIVSFDKYFKQHQGIILLWFICQQATRESFSRPLWRLWCLGQKLLPCSCGRSKSNPFQLPSYDYNILSLTKCHNIWRSDNTSLSNHSTAFFDMSWNLESPLLQYYTSTVYPYLFIYTVIHFQAYPATRPHPQSAFPLSLTHPGRHLAMSAQSSQHVKGYSCNRFPWLGLGPEA